MHFSDVIELTPVVAPQVHTRGPSGLRLWLLALAAIAASSSTQARAWCSGWRRF
ncbi:MAG: hypothetical protein JSR46_12120 [Verrucomicrobia bacterium]|nr:hypothetical protein [Verrucomicrobiota bacterium]